MKYIDVVDQCGHRHPVALCDLPAFVAECVEEKRAMVAAAKAKAEADAKLAADIEAVRQQAEAKAAEALANPMDLAVPAQW